MKGGRGPGVWEGAGAGRGDGDARPHAHTCYVFAAGHADQCATSAPEPVTVAPPYQPVPSKACTISKNQAVRLNPGEKRLEPSFKTNGPGKGKVMNYLQGRLVCRN